MKTKLTGTLVHNNLSKSKKSSHIQPIIVTTSCTSNISDTTSRKQKVRSNSESDRVSLSLSSGERLDTGSSSKNSSNHSLRGQPLSFEETSSAIAPASVALANYEGNVTVSATSNNSITKTITSGSTTFNHSNNRIDSNIQMLEEIIDPIAEEDDEVDVENADGDAFSDLASSAPVKISVGSFKQKNSKSSKPNTSIGLTALKLNLKSQSKTKTSDTDKQSKINTSKSLNDNSVHKVKEKSYMQKAPISLDKGRGNLLLGRKCIKVMENKTATSSEGDELTLSPEADITECKTHTDAESSTPSENNKKESGKLGYNNLIASLLRTTTL